MRVLGIFVTFNPAPALLENIRALLPQVSEVLVVDNGSGPASQSVLGEVAGISNVRVIRNERNLGIGAALNIGIAYARESDYPWIATFDQDSVPPLDFVEKMLSAYQAQPNKESIGLIAPGYADPQSGRLLTSRGRDITAMTSGNLVKTEVFRRCGEYNMDYFIDYVDHEFCLRMRAHGYDLLRASDVNILHHLGNISIYNLFGRNFMVTNHSAFRRYYITRNRILTYRRYFYREAAWCFMDMRSLVVEVLKIVAWEGDKRTKLFHIGKGFLHGLTGRTGPL